MQKTIQISKEYTRTHGIEINHQIVEHPIVKQKIPQGHLDLSIWDFAGQQEYYNSHHYFLQNRSIFLILWKMNEPKDSTRGLGGISFWLKSLSIHLQSSDENKEGNSFSIIIVGTHLDHKNVKKDEQSVKERQNEIKRIIQESGLKAKIEIKEVSCVNSIDKMRDLEETIYRHALDHDYMGERIPKTYLEVEKVIEDLSENKKQLDDIPVVEVDEIVSETNKRMSVSKELVIRSIKLLREWGKCIYFDQTETLSNTVILDPRFLTQDALAQLFNINTEVKNKIKNGTIQHKDLHLIWKKFANKSNFDSLCKKLIEMMGA